MTLCSGGIESQARLSLRHVARILAAHGGETGRLTLQHVVQAVCYVTSRDCIVVANRQWQMSLSDGDTGDQQVGGLVTMVWFDALLIPYSE